MLINYSFSITSIIVLFLIPLNAASRLNWLALASTSTQNYHIPYRTHRNNDNHYQVLCDRLPGLNSVQKKICQSHPFAMPHVSRGAKESIYECREQFKAERWNCSEPLEHENGKNPKTFVVLLEKTLQQSNKESAFVSAITSAGIVHAITKACSMGNMTECGCDNQPGKQRFIDATPQAAGDITPKKNEPFIWAGCSDDISYGVKFAREFLDRYEREQYDITGNVKHLMNLHNHFAGREAISQNMRRQCRCHGVSGSCELKTCWLQMPKFSEIGDMLKKRYDHYSVQVAKKSKKRLRRKERSERRIPLRGTEIAYITRSPSYCERNETLGICGTQERECNPNSLGTDSCDLLCCGRGYNTREEVRIVRCHCKFVWCCQVKCKECKELVRISTCK
uniref:Protein Wnt n=1 Tax=Parastrongyloides trichosuri TaxID=131310 RepID=A0A0N4ZIR8_PARTI